MNIFRSRPKTTATGIAAALALTVSFIGGWEGRRTVAYQDIVGVWTVCYGETRGVQPGDTYTVAECEDMLVDAVLEFERDLDALIDPQVLPTIPVETKIALVSWAYNVGIGNARQSTLLRKLNAGDLEGACNELPRWNRAGGRVIRGLTNRRVAERELCLGGLDG